jgi:hypothetical protein
MAVKGTIGGMLKFYSHKKQQFMAKGNSTGPWSAALTPSAGNTKGGSITVPLTSYMTSLESAVWQLTIFVFICKTD